MIDILLPFYGDPDLMRDTVRSVLAQTREEFRLVVVDDGYPDPSVREWFSQLGDARVEYHRNEVNLGANRNYTRALGLATADRVVVMGADDLLLPNFLEVVESAIARFPDAAIVQCGVEVIDEHDRVIHPLGDRVKTALAPRPTEATSMSGQSAMVSILRGNWTYFPSLCWRRDLITTIGFRPDFHVVQDMALVMDVLIGGGRLVVTPETAFRYRRHAGSDSAVKTVSGSRFHEEQQYFRTIAEELRARGLTRAARAARAHLTSRLHAASLVPVAARSRDFAAVTRLIGHATSWPGSRI